jgi:hypothetical protein
VEKGNIRKKGNESAGVSHNGLPSRQTHLSPGPPPSQQSMHQYVQDRQQSQSNQPQVQAVREVHWGITHKHCKMNNLQIVRGQLGLPSVAAAAKEGQNQVKPGSKAVESTPCLLIHFEYDNVP